MYILNVNSTITPWFSPHKWSAELGHHWFRSWLVARLVPSHYLNQWWPHQSNPKQHFLMKKNIEMNRFSLTNLYSKLSSAILPPVCPGAMSKILDTKLLPWLYMIQYILTKWIISIMLVYDKYYRKHKQMAVILQPAQAFCTLLNNIKAVAISHFATIH